MNRTIKLLLIILTLGITGIASAATEFSVQFSGLQGDLKKNVENTLKNERAQVRQPITKDGVQNYLKNASKLIQKALQPYGYFHPKIRSRLSYTTNHWTAYFDINPGPSVVLTQIDLKILGPGKNDPVFQKFTQKLPIKPGQTLNTTEYNKTKQLLYDIASTRGYFKATMLENKIYINLKNRTARVVIRFQTGPRAKFGYTTFSNIPLSDIFLNRFLRYQKGMYYDYKRIEVTQQDLINSNYFSQVIINPVPEHIRNGEVPIHVKLILRKRYAYIFGAGYGTDTGPRATIGFDVRRVNQQGHQFKTLIQAAKNLSNASVIYTIPGRHPASDHWVFSTGYADFDQVTGTGKSFKVEGAYITSLGQWKQTIALTYLRERYSIVGFPFTKTNVLFPNIHWAYITKHETLYPKSGFSFSGLLAGTPEYGPSETAFAQGRFDLKLFFTLFNSTRIILRNSLARSEVNEIQSLPFSLQLFAGGARSIRGYSYNQIGPGRNLFIGSFEIQQRIFGNWYLAGFIDAGNVTEDSPFKHLNVGVGPGIAWLSPVGVLEITVANAITQPNKPWVIQFTMGPEI